jgi:hypothetical protein
MAPIVCHTGNSLIFSGSSSAQASILPFSSPAIIRNIFFATLISFVVIVSHSCCGLEAMTKQLTFLFNLVHHFMETVK